jgi:hypothetical protein
MDEANYYITKNMHKSYLEKRFISSEIGFPNFRGDGTGLVPCDSPSANTAFQFCCIENNYQATCVAVIYFILFLFFEVLSHHKHK